MEWRQKYLVSPGWNLSRFIPGHGVPCLLGDTRWTLVLDLWLRVTLGAWLLERALCAALIRSYIYIECTYMDLFIFIEQKSVG